MSLKNDLETQEEYEIEIEVEIEKTINEWVWFSLVILDN